jgi:hypothetical protein
VSSVYTRRAARPSQAFSTAPPFEDEAEAAFIFTSPDWALPDTDPEAAPDGGESGDVHFEGKLLVVAGPAKLVEIFARRKCREPVVRVACLETGEQIRFDRPRGRRARKWLLNQLRRLVGETLTDLCPCGCGDGICFGVAADDGE